MTRAAVIISLGFLFEDEIDFTFAANQLENVVKMLLVHAYFSERSYIILPTITKSVPNFQKSWYPCSFSPQFLHLEIIR